jgi:hypothetical protein
MTPFSQFIIIFHALMGMSVGFFAATTAGWPARVALLAAGCAFGILTGVMICYTPRKIRSAAKTIRHNPLLAVLLSTFAHLVWIGVAVSFWWICIDLLTARTVL